ncbi:ROK family protein [Athalassotoga saccharophila]|uniref:N-acetylglucosamine repressor n=1 Tax=Athalassotoga saccharophila TaxID=1441386 RepID=A0A6N4TF10_9BACT|nr:ROK family protein [Athalassotoga saccharophila]BBJ29085.1 N-acetylglucosamine repressor [Athalassotoga saccharophila]
MNAISSVGLRNSLRIFETLMVKNASRVEIANELDLTKTTVGEITKNFIDLGFIREKEKTHDSRIGKPQTLLEIVPDAFHVAGIGILRKQVEGCIVDADGKILRRKSKYYKSFDYNSIINSIFEVTDDLIAGNRDKIDAIAFGAPGTLDSKNGIILKPAKFLEFENVPLAKIFSDRYKVNAWIENDADVAAIAEKYYGKGKNLNSFISIHMEEGIGSGIILNGEIHHGEYGYAGEMGHFLVKDNGTFKYLEDLYGADAILERTRMFGIPDFESLKKAEKNKDKKVIEFLQEIGEEVGAVIVSMIHLTGISTIFLGGKATYLGNTFLNSVRSTIKKYLFYDHEVKVELSTLGDAFVVALGASAHGRVKYVEKVLKK